MQSEEAAQQRRDAEMKDEEAEAGEVAMALEAGYGPGTGTDAAKKLLGNHGTGLRRQWRSQQGGKRYRWLIRSLMRICAIVSVLWIARVVIETYIWVYYYRHARAPSAVVFYTRVIMTRWVGRWVGLAGSERTAKQRGRGTWESMV